MISLKRSVAPGRIVINRVGNKGGIASVTCSSRFDNVVLVFF